MGAVHRKKSFTAMAAEDARENKILTAKAAKDSIIKTQGREDNAKEARDQAGAVLTAQAAHWSPLFSSGSSTPIGRPEPNRRPPKVLENRRGLDDVRVPAVR